ncbi:MAG: NAD(P)-dependent oxidoreductase [Acidobacteriota bacterium]
MDTDARSDVVTACPLTALTRGWIGARGLSLMRPPWVLTNVGRAEIIQQQKAACNLILRLLLLR